MVPSMVLRASAVWQRLVVPRTVRASPLPTQPCARPAENVSWTVAFYLSTRTQEVDGHITNSLAPRICYSEAEKNRAAAPAALDFTQSRCLDCYRIT
mmetsp:Transcript_55681/g.120303  ORF Transcript_55681/g.120303 Transcript_55681/m.120303 type:complete len:97 (-) Transcript_55681:2-292(-)